MDEQLELQLEEPLEIPLDERNRKTEQKVFTLAKPTTQETTCNTIGYCYCPKCNPR